MNKRIQLFMALPLHIHVERWRERFVRWIVWHLPKYLVMWCYVRVGAYATGGEYGDTEVSALSMMDALKRWESA